METDQAYKSTQLIKPSAIDLSKNSQNQSHLLDKGSPEEVFQYKNIYTDVKSTVIDGPVKTTKVDKITKIPQVIFQERKVLATPVKKKKKVVTKEVEIENIIEVPEVQEKVVYNEIKVPTYVDVPVVHPRQAVYYQQISKNVPKGVELVVTQTFEVPQIKPKYVEVPVPIYVPCYIEVPIPAHYIPTDNTTDKEYFTSGVSNNSKVSRHTPLWNATSERAQNVNAPTTVNPIPQANEVEQTDAPNSKCLEPNVCDSELKDVEDMVVAGDI